MKKLLIVLIFLGCSCGWASVDIGQEQAYQAAQQQLEIIQEKNHLVRQQLTEMHQLVQQKMLKLTPSAVSVARLEKASLSLTLLQANLESANIAVAEGVQAAEATNIKIESLKRRLHDVTLAAGTTPAVKNRLDDLQSQLNGYYQLQKVQTAQLEALQTAKQLAEALYEQQSEWRNNLLTFYEKQQQEDKRVEAQKKELYFQTIQQQWLNRLAELNRQLQHLPAETLNNKEEVAKLEIAILEAQEKGNLSRLELVFTRLWNQANDLNSVLQKQDFYLQSDQLQREITTLLDQAQALIGLIQSKLTLLEKQKNIEEQLRQRRIISAGEYRANAHLISNLAEQYQELLNNGKILLVHINDYQDTINHTLNTMIVRRQGLPGFNMWAWANLGKKLLVMPSLAFKALEAMKDALIFNLHHLPHWRILILILFSLVWIGLWFLLRKGIAAVLLKLIEKRRNTSRNVLYIVLQMLRSNLISLFLLLNIISFLWGGGFTFKVFTPVLTLLLVWVGFKAAVDLSRVLLLETSERGEGKDIALYHYLQGIFISGGILTLLTILSHQLPVDYEVSDFFNRLFMLYLLIASALLLWQWNRIPSLINFYLAETSPRVKSIVTLLSFLIPITVLVNAAIGFAGYISLAWAMSRYALIFLLILAGYIMGRGFIHDFFDWLSEVFIRRFRNGWLWTQAYLSPLDRILRLLWFGLSLYGLFYWYGWNQHSYVIQKLQWLVHLPLLKISNTVITLLGLAEFALAGALLLWLAKWTREFAYRWWYARAKDVGVRHSLAVFTQYTVVSVGALIILQWSGMDLSGIHLILGALAFGVGFGLRDLARNYVSGVLMLVERPLRTGDIVSIGNFEGQVTHIGMRSTTVRTWDRMEVLVPNSETFERSFVNWTRQDNIVRTVIKISISRQDDLDRVVQSISEELSKIKEILKDPEPQVYLKDMSQSLIEFEIRYFINIVESISRAYVRSMLLFSIWKRFKEMGIQPPFPQQDIHIRSLPDKK